MYEYALQGFLLGLAYLAPIGMQNMYVINSAIRMTRLRAYQVAGMTFIFDISLALACFFGIGFVLEKFPALKVIILLVGFVAVTYIGIRLILSKPELKDVEMNEPLSKIAFMCFAVTWLNPNAVIDGTMLLGGIRASLPAGESNLFILGVALASFTWFTGIVTAVSTFKSRIGERTFKFINVLCGIVIIVYGIMLGLSFLELFI
jgi:L-lysine exporter family protein LysE/ArgO